MLGLLALEMTFLSRSGWSPLYPLVSGKEINIIYRSTYTFAQCISTVSDARAGIQ